MKDKNNNKMTFWYGVDSDKETYKVSYTKVNVFSDEEWFEVQFYRTKKDILKLFHMCEKKGGFVDGSKHTPKNGGEEINQIWRIKDISISLMTDKDIKDFPKDYYGLANKGERQITMVDGHKMKYTKDACLRYRVRNDDSNVDYSIKGSTPYSVDFDNQRDYRTNKDYKEVRV